jgi:hypothetical protein
MFDLIAQAFGTTVLVVFASGDLVLPRTKFGEPTIVGGRRY